jgi:hypothetical protein
MRSGIDLDLPQQVGQLLSIYPRVVGLAGGLQDVRGSDFARGIALCIAMTMP